MLHHWCLERNWVWKPQSLPEWALDPDSLHSGQTGCCFDTLMKCLSASGHRRKSLIRDTYATPLEPVKHVPEKLLISVYFSTVTKATHSNLLQIIKSHQQNKCLVTNDWWPRPLTVPGTEISPQNQSQKEEQLNQPTTSCLATCNHVKHFLPVKDTTFNWPLAYL